MSEERNSYDVGILTFWNVPNYGTFAQAYALQKFIHALNEKRDCKQIAYLNQRHFDFYYSRLPRCNPFHKTFYRDLWNRAFPFSQYYKKKRSFLESYKKISHTKEMTAQELEQAKFDTVVLGSDIIWDYSFEIFDKDPFLFGSKLNAKKKISYAASFGTIKESEPIPEFVKKSLLDMDEISVRDLNSARIVEKIVGKKPEVVLDPTYLWDFTKDSNVIKPQYENYMVVYGQDFSENSIKEIINYAKENKLTLICLDCNNDNYSWCDITVRQCDLTPFEWIGYFRYAKTIATTTFHGLTFSIIFNKKFAFCKTQFIMDKAGDFLKSIGLYELFNKEKVTIKEMIDHDWNYSFINSKIEERRRISIKFIEENIK